MDRFSSFNPKATLLFFFAQIVIVIAIFNPVLIAISFASACIYKIVLNGKSAFKYIFSLVLPIVLIVAVFNMIFTHYGMTVLFTINDSNYTLESLFYGFSQGLMLVTVLLWFNIYSQQITSEQFISVFGKLAPSLSLVFSMSLSFIPRLRENAKQINEARMLLDTNENKLKKSMSNFSALVTMSLEQSIETADSMKARGYNKNRTVYNKYRFSIFDLLLIISIIAMLVSLILYKAFGFLTFIYEPTITAIKLPVLAVIIYSLFAFLPIIINLVEGVKWHILKQKA